MTGAEQAASATYMAAFEALEGIIKCLTANAKRLKIDSKLLTATYDVFYSRKPSNSMLTRNVGTYQYLFFTSPENFRQVRRKRRSLQPSLQKVRIFLIRLGICNEAAPSVTSDEDSWRRFAEHALASVNRMLAHPSNQDALGFTVSPKSMLPDVTTKQDDSPAAALVPLKWDSHAEERDMATSFAKQTLRSGNFATPPGPGEAFLSLDLNCPQVQFEKFCTSLKRCLLKFDCAGGHTAPVAQRTGGKQGVVFDNARFIVCDTSRSKPSWTVEQVQPGGIGLVQSIADTFIAIGNLQPGARVKATISADVKEVPVAFTVPEGQGLSLLKQKVWQRLEQADKLGLDDHHPILATSEYPLAARDDIA